MTRKFKSWFGNDSGVVAIEFAMLSLPFFLLLMGMIETSLFYASSVVLEGGTAEAARLIRTGQAQNSGNAQTDFANALCDQVSGLIACNSIKYESIVMPAGTFSSAQANQPQFDANGNFVSQGFSAGASCDIVLIRTVYKYQFMMPLIGNLMNGGAGTNLISTDIIKNEPYTFGGTLC